MGANIEKTKDTFVYFLYSEQQVSERSTIEKTMSRVFTPGTVIINGRKKLFTEISKKSSNRYPDCKVVASGYRSQLVFTMPSAK
jgi:hypothetical protein